ncbi:putative membrane protein YeiB [Aeromicrobium panaciterrae]|uniref:Membrane protein YeiB n=1 Tax=Aeromicrobium panaciterrae TaxID=363861 RepID=A0ABU1UMZ6_9ACTN|nr:heparan-alpha-glucosaminide N-acetyltransferase domain-containing protein [Aeromicrobium panaciterrae]MDR7086556.1 putative membrane protein YeiB [Aeromicrobium panaciterrae]
MPRPGSRIEAVDLARGLALIGMMFTHIGPHWMNKNPPVGDVIAGGRAAPLFALLAGVALTIVHQRDPRGAGSTRATWIRAVLLIALGLALGSLEHVPMFIILAYYGVMIVLVLPFRRLSTTWLFVLGTVWALVAPVVLLWAQREKQVYTQQTEWADLQHPGELFMEIVVWGIYPVGVWIAYVLIGMAIGRLDLRSVKVAWRLVATGVALVVSTLAAGMVAIKAGVFDDLLDGTWRGLFVGPVYPYERPTWDELLLVGQHTSRPLGMLSAIGSAILVVGLCALLVKVPWARLVLTPVRAAGAMTLTLYTVHVLWSWRLRVDFLHDHPGGVHEGTYEIWLLQVVVLAAAATIWSLSFGKGPLEWLVRRLSVWGKEKSAPKGA